MPVNPSVARRLRRTAEGLVAGLLLAGSAAQAATLQAAYVFYDWKTPAVVASPTFTFLGTGGYKLTLNSSKVATAATAITAPIAFTVDNALTYNAKAGTIDSGETYSTSRATYVNSEIGTWDDAGIVNDGTSDAKLNIDFGDTSAVWLNTPKTGYTGLIIAEDAGLDPFKLSTPSTAYLTGTVVFDGFTRGLRDWLVGTGNFSRPDTSNPGNMDQVFLFLFDAPVTTGLVRIGETTNFGGALLEVDFAGTGRLTAVPLPPAVLLFGSALLGLGLLARRRV